MEVAVLTLWVFATFQVSFSADPCAGKICPPTLECTFPKTPILLHQPDQCCPKTVCVCKGTNTRTSSHVSSDSYYRDLEQRYTNCTLVDGNLELAVITPNPKSNVIQPIEFTKHIEQVTGYVLISRVYVDYIDLSSLRLIRGIEKYVESNNANTRCPGKNNQSVVVQGRQYALFVEHCDDKNQNYLRELRMQNLTEILDGDVGFVNNSLCNMNNIIWEGEIFKLGSTQKVIDKNFKNFRQCPICNFCPPVTVKGTVRTDYCWGNSTSLCQRITRTVCTNCGGPCNRHLTCCSDSCAGGCLDTMPSIIATAEKAKYCVGCNKINNDGKCEAVCPFESQMDPDRGGISSVVSKYQFARYCVNQCPENVPKTGKYCKRYCEKGTFDYENNTCSPCRDGGKCGNICYGLGVDHGPLRNHTYIDASNIHHFNRNCTIIVGNLVFITSTFKGDTFCQLKPVTYDTIVDAFQNVEEITGYLAIEYWHRNDLCLFKNLKRIRGKQLKGQSFALTVYTGESQLRELCLNSLERIDNGVANIDRNKLLCYADTIQWQQITNSTTTSLVVDNQKTSSCGHALFTNNRRLCLTSSVNWTDIFAHSRQSYIHRGKSRCKKVSCHEDCDQGCWGKLNTQCRKCKYFADRTNSSGKFTSKWIPDPQTGYVMPGHNVTTCVKECDFRKGVYPSDNKECLPCHEQCAKTCHGPSPYNCTKCKHFTLDGECVPACPITHYQDTNNTCSPCSTSCIGGCKGPEDLLGLLGCTKCHESLDLETKIYTFHGQQCQICKPDENQCSDGCTLFNRTSDLHCYFPPGMDYTVIAVVSVVAALIIFTPIIIWICRKRNTIKRMKKTIEKNMVGEQGMIDNEATPLTPSGASPNQAHLRIVKENELAIGRMLGSGAFGAVHKAIWTPINIQGEKIKIAVALKTLKTPGDISAAANNEIMDEAYMMASVDCIYLVRLLGICMTEQVSLITQLMPLGSLLEYVRNTRNQETIHAGQVLSWSTQIAKGMNYLAEKHLVHRDLAARNVLVKTPNHVKITDFGLAKMLTDKEDIYHAEGGKLPIKWLAIECITERTFSHLSDVWAFGVTCWELLTLGGRPYDGVRAVDMLSLLGRGERLPQPPSATIDIYMILIKCWMVDRLCRPNFGELVKEFTAMSKDPSRFVVMKTVDGSCITSPSPTDEMQFFQQLLAEERGDDGSMLADEPDQYLLRDNVIGKRDNKYTPMSALNSSSDDGVETSKPEYENQPALSNMQETSFSERPRGERLFSRNTPSANFSQSISSSSNGMGRIPEGEEPISPSLDPDDVFSEAGHANKSAATTDETLVNRKDSEETQRYTEDPTTRKHLFSEALSDCNRIHEHDGTFLLDNEEYLIPTPSKKIPDKPRQTPEETEPNKPKVYLDLEGPQSPTSSLANQSYMHTDSLNQPPQNSDYEQLSACKGGQLEVDYVNTIEGESLTPTFFENAEYMATDSGIGEDSQSLLSRGNTGNRGNRKASTQSSFDENDEIHNRHKQKNGVSRPTKSAKHNQSNHKWSASSDDSVENPFHAAIENPEYMGLVSANVKQPNNTRTVTHTAI